MDTTNTKDRELIVTRLLDADIKLVWEAWTKPEHIAQWWGPDGFTNTISEMDFIPEGEWQLVMHGPDGTDYKNRSMFKEIIPFEKIVFHHVSGYAVRSLIIHRNRPKIPGRRQIFFFKTDLITILASV